VLTLSICGFAVLTIINLGILAALVILDRAPVAVAASPEGMRRQARQWQLCQEHRDAPARPRAANIRARARRRIAAARELESPASISTISLLAGTAGDPCGTGPTGRKHVP
jgi:hypothetical protein